MLKKILICEDNKGVAESLSRNLGDLGYSIAVLAQEENPMYVVENIEEIVKKEQPDYALIDGLHGKCFEVADLAKKTKPDIKNIIFSYAEHIINAAKKRGYVAFDKSKLEKLEEHLENN